MGLDEILKEFFKKSLEDIIKYGFKKKKKLIFWTLGFLFLVGLVILLLLGFIMGIIAILLILLWKVITSFI